MGKARRSGVVVVLVTVPNAGVAEQLAKTLVEEGLIACANIVPGVRSIYSWKGALCDDAELLLLMKTRRTAFERLRARIVTMHPSEVPEVLALAVVDGHAPYVAWVMEATTAGTRSPLPTRVGRGSGRGAGRGAGR